MCIRLFDVASKERRKQNTVFRRHYYTCLEQESKWRSAEKIKMPEDGERPTPEIRYYYYYYIFVLAAY